MGKVKEVSLNIPAESDYISVVRLAISGIAARMDFTIDDIEDLKIAISEACTNVVQHAYTNSDEGHIQIACSVNNAKLEVEVSDSGCGFDTANISSKKHEDDDHEEFGLGLGLTFIKSLMDETEFSSEPGKGSVIKMVKLAPTSSQ